MAPTGVTAAIRTLEEALDKLRFIGLVCQNGSVDLLGPEHFVREILQDVQRASAQIGEIRRSLHPRIPQQR